MQPPHAQDASQAPCHGSLASTLGAVHHPGLPAVDLGHRQPERLEPALEGGEDLVVEMEPAAEGRGDGLAGHVVGGGAEAAGDQDEVDAGRRLRSSAATSSSESPITALRRSSTP